MFHEQLNTDENKSRLQLISEVTDLRRRNSELESSDIQLKHEADRYAQYGKRMKKLAELSMMLAGDPIVIFEKIARMIGELLDVKIVCLSEINDGKLDFLSLYNQGQVLHNAGTCPLDVTPCATVLETKDFRVYHGVADKFPEAVFLKQHNAYSYCGFPALDSNGNVVAVICLLDDRLHEFTDADKDLLQAFTQRISFEIERKNYLAEREQAEAERKKLEDQLNQSQKMEAIGTLAGGIAHDFNNLLTPILGYAELVQAKLPQNGKAHGSLQEVINAALRAKELVEQILSISRKSEYSCQPLKIQPIIKEGLKLLRASIPTNIEIRHDIGERCGAILADPTQIHQVIMNLCTNAYHAMQTTGGVLTVTLSETEIGRNDFFCTSLALQPGKYVKLEVSDTGHGMDAATRERIFEPYFTTKDPEKGTGLGLSVVHGIVKKHGGHISVYSEPEKGTVFHIYLPQVAVGNAVSHEAAVLDTVPKGTERVLVVDDEPIIVQMVEELLEMLGYQVTVFTSSTDALQAFRAEPQRFDLIITDMTMPNTSGAELTRELLAVRPDIPVILCTGFSEAIDEEKAKALGARDFIMKPIMFNAIAHTVRKVLDA